jgi:hypothetical protein
MTDRQEGEHVLPLLAELATGAITGEDRARALLHASGCPACRTELAQLSKVADELLLLAPAHEPPAGFESRVMAAIVDGTPPRLPARRRRMPAGPGWLRRPHRRLLRITASALALALAATLGAGAVWQATAADRREAAEQRAMLNFTHGRYISALAVRDTWGARTGTLWLYEGDPSWMVVDVSGVPDGDYHMVVIDKDGINHASGTCTMKRGWGTYAYRLWQPVSQVATVQLNGPIQLTARA